MSKQREALKIALEVLDSKHNFQSAEWRHMHYQAFQIIREALAEPEPEPVARVKTVGGYPDASEHTVEWLVKFKDVMSGQLLYTAPPARKPLTDAEMRQCANAMDAEPLSEGWKELIKFARAIERAHGIGD